MSALVSLTTIVVADSRDWSLVMVDAWIYGIVVGWDDDEGDALPEVAARFQWSPDTVAVLKSLRVEYAALAGEGTS